MQSHISSGCKNLNKTRSICVLAMTRKANNQRQNIFAQMYYMMLNVLNSLTALKMRPTGTQTKVCSQLSCGLLKCTEFEKKTTFLINNC